MWDWRFFVVKDMRISWWASRQAYESSDGSPAHSPQGLPTATTAFQDFVAVVRQRTTISLSETLTTESSSCRGAIDLTLSSVKVETDPLKHKQFSVRPKRVWADGATTDKNKDALRVYVFDTTDSECSREEWIETIRIHSFSAELERRGAVHPETTNATAEPEFWIDHSVSAEQQRAAEAAKAVLLKRQQTLAERGPRKKKPGAG